jgi:hypothetical protein
VTEIDSLEPRRLFASAVPVLINAGGAAFTDTIGRTFAADNYFTGGAIGQSSPVDVLGTKDDSLFLDYRLGTSFSYAIPVVNGHYALWLEFADPTFATAGQRTFNVVAEGSQVLTNFDIASAAGGAQTAIAKCFDTKVSDGVLNLSFTGTKNQAIVSAIALIPTDVPNFVLPYTDAAHDAATQLVDSNRQLYNVGQYMEFYATENKSRFPNDLATLVTTQDMPLAEVADPRTDTVIPRGESSDLEAAAWVASRNDFIYLAKGLSAQKVSADTVLAYENPNRVNGDIAVMYGSGYVGDLDRASAAALIGYTDGPPTEPPPPPPTIPAADPNILTSRQNLVTLSNALQNYANDFHGKFPTDLGTLYADHFVTDVNVFVDPRGTTQPPPASDTDAQKIAWIDSSSDYLMNYLGQSESVRDLNAPVLSENPAQVNNGLDMWIDGIGIVFRETQWALQSLKRDTPSLASGSFVTNPDPATLTFRFNVPAIVPSTVQPSDVSLVNLDNGQTANTSGATASYDVATRNFKLSIPPAVLASLPSGNYRAKLIAGTVADAFGNALASSFTFDFSLLVGDANGDGQVDSSDFMLMSQNFGDTGGASLFQGDVNFDGTVNALDFNTLATNYGQGSTAAGASALPAAAPVGSLFADQPIQNYDSVLA